MVTCSRCGQDADLPADRPRLFRGQRQHAPTLVSVRCPQCGHQIDLVS
jgi:DNA-directed RNA polymerase subunit RPC12/RpoP